MHRYQICNDSSAVCHNCFTKNNGIKVFFYFMNAFLSVPVLYLSILITSSTQSTLALLYKLNHLRLLHFPHLFRSQLTASFDNLFLHLLSFGFLIVYFQIIK